LFLITFQGCVRNYNDKHTYIGIHDEPTIYFKVRKIKVSKGTCTKRLQNRNKNEHHLSIRNIATSRSLLTLISLFSFPPDWFTAQVYPWYIEITVSFHFFPFPFRIRNFFSHAFYTFYIVRHFFLSKYYYINHVTTIRTFAPNHKSYLTILVK